jgi:F0F1-type ATP synthase delta subunit
VVGGLVVKMGDTVIDGSVARRLSELRLRLAGA